MGLFSSKGKPVEALYKKRDVKGLICVLSSDTRTTNEKEWAARYLGEWLDSAGPDILEPLSAVLRSRSAELSMVREAAVNSFLGMLLTEKKSNKEIVEKWASQPLMSLLVEGEGYDAAKAALALGLLGNESAVEPLRIGLKKRMRFRDFWIPQLSAVGLALIGNSEALKLLEDDPNSIGHFGLIDQWDHDFGLVRLPGGSDWIKKISRSMLSQLAENSKSADTRPPIERLADPQSLEALCASARALKDCIDNDEVRLLFYTGGVDIQIWLDRDSCRFDEADFENSRGRVHLVGRLTLNYEKLRCTADIDLSTLEGVGRLLPVSDEEYDSMRITSGEKQYSHQCHKLGDLRRFPGWEEEKRAGSIELNDETKVWLRSDCRVFENPWEGSGYPIYSNVSPEWISFCRDVLLFRHERVLERMDIESGVRLDKELSVLDSKNASETSPNRSDIDEETKGRESELLIRQLEHRFGQVSDGMKERIRSGDRFELEHWGSKILVAKRPEDLFE